MNALRGTALEAAVVVTTAAAELPLAPTLERMAFVGALSEVEDGVYATAVVVAFEPAEEEPEEAKDEEAPGPEPPADAFVWMYKSWSLAGPCCALGDVSRIT
jgi:hypothetical protein